MTHFLKRQRLTKEDLEEIVNNSEDSSSLEAICKTDILGEIYLLKRIASPTQ